MPRSFPSVLHSAVNLPYAFLFCLISCVLVDIANWQAVHYNTRRLWENLLSSLLPFNTTLCPVWPYQCCSAPGVMLLNFLHPRVFCLKSLLYVCLPNRGRHFGQAGYHKNSIILSSCSFLCRPSRQFHLKRTLTAWEQNDKKDEVKS